LLGEIFANALARKRSDEALRASEEQISLAAESTNLGVWSWDIAKDSIWATEKCRDLYGVSPEQKICLQTFLDTLHHDDSDRVRLAVQLALRERREFAEEYRVALSNGRVRWIGAFGRGNYNGAGEPIHMLGVSIDLTSRKQMEERLIHEREFLRQVIDVDPNFIFAKDREGRFTLANQAVADAYGTTVENLVGKSDADLNQNIEEVEFFRRLDQEVMATKQERFIPEERMTDAKGRVRWLQTVKRPLFTDDGQASQVLGSATDITERKRAEEKFRLAVEASPNAIVMVNGQGQIVLVNAQTEKLFGYTRGELSGQPVETLVPERFRAVHPAHRKGFFTAPRGRPIGAGRELFGLRKDGSEFLVEIGLNPIESADGVFVLTAIVDITERKRTESELHRNREELTHITRVSALGELAASLAHELNQPLTAILSNAQAAQRFLSAQPADLEEVKEILKDIVADNQRAGEVIRRMRALVKKEDLAFVHLDLATVIREVMQLVQGDATLRNVRLSFEAQSQSTLARGDRVQLQQVVLNLLLNAFEAMQETPSQEREVMVRAQVNGAGVVEISVRDHGIGFPSDKLAKIFDPFYTTKRDGLGMGLAISRSIVEAHGGRLWAKNNTDRGSTFYFTIPATRHEASLGTPVD
jgi:two-component system sensor kinase FixL